MSVAIPGKSPHSRAQDLLQSIEGVVAARVVADDAGRIIEIHVLCPPHFHPKQVVRNVESALTAGLGIEIDRRIVSVAQIDATAEANGSGPDPATRAAEPAPTPTTDAADDSTRAATNDATEHASAHPTTAAPSAADASNGAAPDSSAAGRVVFVGFSAHTDAAQRVRVEVHLRNAGGEVHGTGHGPDTPQGRATAGARAALAALSEIHGEERVALEGATVVHAHGRAYVHVAAHGLVARRPVSLTGTAALERSAEEAAVLAVLQATNRWIGPGD